MGRLLVILLAMLLPLRGWSAERVAIQMSQTQAIVEIVGEHVFMASMPADCPMLAQPVSGTEKSPRPSKDYAGCQTCQLCMPLASLSLPQTHFMAYERQIHPVPASASFISSDLARQVKPPIL